MVRFFVSLAAGLALLAKASATFQRRECVHAVTALDGDTCQSIANDWDIEEAEFEQYNPQVGNGCSNGVVAGQQYCIEWQYTSTTMKTTIKAAVKAISTAASPVTTTITGSSVSSPTQSSIISSCTKYYKAVSGDSCHSIATNAGTFSVADFEKWSPAVGSDCYHLLAGYYYYAAVPGTPTTTVPSGLQPEQTGIVSNCKKYYKVQSGDCCDKIVQQYGISLTQL